jgi:hypothetical protein
MDGHDRKPMDETRLASIGQAPTPAYRIPCTCGWVGAWWTSALKAANAYERHVRRETTHQ